MNFYWSGFRRIIFPLLILILCQWAFSAETPVANGYPPMSSKDSLNAPGMLPKSVVDSLKSLKIVKHDFNHREQIITGSVIMACLAMIMVTMNNYNPR